MIRLLLAVSIAALGVFSMSVEVYASHHSDRQAVIDQLIALPPSSNSWANDYVGEAVKSLQAAQASKYWATADTMNYPAGYDVFRTHDYKALSKLYAGSVREAYGDAFIQSLVDQIVAIDRAIAQAAVDAQPAGLVKNKALQSMAQGDAAEPYKSTSYYGYAWKLVHQY